MGAYAPAGFRNKKAPKFFSNFGANIFMHLHTLRRESRQKEKEPNILTLCSVAYCRTGCFRLPRFFASGCAFAPKASFPTFTVPFLRRGFSPHSSVPAQSAQAMFLYAIFIFPNLLWTLLRNLSIDSRKNSKNGSCDAFCRCSKLCFCIKKTRSNASGLFWWAIGDSNPGHLD